MDKTDLRNKRRQDKHHKKVPAPKPAKKTATPKVPEVQHTGPIVVCDQRYGKRQIQQNWTEDRDLPSEGSESEDEQLNAADFEKLLTVPPSTGGHFLLSSEKHWLAPDTGLLGEDKKNISSELFRIDTKLLNASLGCIPFHERLGYDEHLFSATELNLMRSKAELQTEAYKKLSNEHNVQSKMVSTKPPKPVPCLVGKYALPKHDPKQQDVSTSRPQAESSNTSDAVSIKSVELKISALKIEPPVIDPAPTANASSPSKTGIVSETKKNDTKEDIQQWLDDILDI